MESGKKNKWIVFVQSFKSGKWRTLTYVNMSLFREQSIPCDPTDYQGGEVPQPQKIIFGVKHDRVSRRTQQCLPTETRTVIDQYICQYLDHNNISSIADIKKSNWQNISGI